MKKQKFINKELQFGANNYQSLPAVLVKAKGIYAYDSTGKKYMDMMSAYSAVSLGHANKRILKTLITQAKKLSVTSRAFYNDQLPFLMEKLCHHSKMDKVIPMNSGAEAVETAIKVARKWGEKIKHIKSDCV